MKILIEYGIDIDAQGPYNGYTAYTMQFAEHIEGSSS